ncbi:MAG: hypothetical protein K2I85_01715 [Alistipes sp.]|nr:hypothetical protein [Alistipes sp.]
MREKQNNWQRIEAVIKWANMSTNYFARHIGLPRGENLYQIKRGNNGISRDVARRIVEKFPQIDKLWLLTGDGQMFVDEPPRGVQIPFYNTDVEQGIGDLEHLEADGDLVIPPAVACDLAMVYSGRAMGQSVPSGTVVFLKNIDRDEIIPGQEYVIISRKIVTLRIVRAADSGAQLRLVAGDRKNYDDIVLSINDIMAVYKVNGKLIINT